MILNDLFEKSILYFFNGSFPNRSAFPWSLSSPDSWNSLRMRSWLVFPFHSRTNSSGTTNDPSCRGFMKRSTRFFKACLEILATNGAIDDGSPDTATGVATSAAAGFVARRAFGTWWSLKDSALGNKGERPGTSPTSNSLEGIELKGLLLGYIIRHFLVCNFRLEHIKKEQLEFII